MKEGKLIVAPSILASDWAKFGEEIVAVEKAGADWIHIDVMDGRFVPPITFGADVVKVAKRVTALPLDVHLMIVEPERHIETFASSGAASISVHAEVSPHLHRTLQQIRACGCKTGVALNPSTPLVALLDIMQEIDTLLIMTVNPGWGGQKFIAPMLDKIRHAAAHIRQHNLNTRIEVDGGINAETAREATAAGASILVAGTSIFQSKNYQAAIASLRK